MVEAESDDGLANGRFIEEGVAVVFRPAVGNRRGPDRREKIEGRVPRVEIAGDRPLWGAALPPPGLIPVLIHREDRLVFDFSHRPVMGEAEGEIAVADGKGFMHHLAAVIAVIIEDVEAAGGRHEVAVAVVIGSPRHEKYAGVLPDLLLVIEGP